MERTLPHLCELVTQAEQVIALIEASSGLMEENETGIGVVLGPRETQLYTEGDVEMINLPDALFEACSFRVSAGRGLCLLFSFQVEESVEQIRLNAVEEGRIAGVAEVETHPNDYDLFTEDQYLEAERMHGRME